MNLLFSLALVVGAISVVLWVVKTSRGSHPPAEAPAAAPSNAAPVAVDAPRFLAPEPEYRDIDRMDGLAFEKYLEDLFTRQGYATERTRYKGDWGADLVLTERGVKTVVQAKRYGAQSVGVQAVQEVVASKAMYGAGGAIVITSSYFTWEAMELARANGVGLWDRDLLRTQLPGGGGAPLPLDAPHLAGPGSLECACCGARLPENVARFCWNHRLRFGGRLYCRAHQDLPASEPRAHSPHPLTLPKAA